MPRPGKCWKMTEKDQIRIDRDGSCTAGRPSCVRTSLNADIGIIRDYKEDGLVTTRPFRLRGNDKKRPKRRCYEATGRGLWIIRLTREVPRRLAWT